MQVKNISMLEEFCHLGCDVVQSVESQLTFLRGMSPSFSRLKGKPKKQSSTCCPLHAGFMLGLPFDPEDGDTLLQNGS
jgi:hypothetical protein